MDDGFWEAGVSDGETVSVGAGRVAVGLGLVAVAGGGVWLGVEVSPWVGLGVSGWVADTSGVMVPEPVQPAMNGKSRKRIVPRQIEPRRAMEAR